jgi:hypothetical protein
MNENFTVAWQLIMPRYNKRLIAMLHAKNLCKMPQVKKDDALSLRQLVNHVSSHLNALQALDLDVPVQDLMLNHLMMATLQPHLQKEWENISTSSTDTPMNAELIKFLESRCRTLELLQTLQLMDTRPSHGSTPTGNRVSRTSHTHIATQVQCSLCHDAHKIFKCDRFLKMNPRQRLSHAKQANLCFNCLQIYTKTQTFSTQMCRQCHKRHHILLHIDEENQPTTHKSFTSNEPTADANGASTAEVNSYCSMKSNSRNHILLATAIVEVMNKNGQFIPCRALLDSGSQTHFITERCVQRLK